MHGTASLDGARPHSTFISAPDGLKLHVMSYGPQPAAGLPVVCLPGLTRTVADFEELAVALATDRDQPRRVFALDYRGRGRSEYDRNVGNYSVLVELADLIAVLTALGVGPAVFVGTSRGGIIAMALAVARPTAIAGVVLNDIGPVIEPKGLMRIKGYVGRLPLPKSFAEGAEILRRLFDAQFPRLDAAGWLQAAQRTWQEHNGRLDPVYDTRLAQTLRDIGPDQPLPALWKEFDALARLPVMVIRGANSDILSADTVAAMRARRADLDVLVVPDQGHAPLLGEADVIGEIAGFIARCDAAHQP
jgi:pimeloyl-ACP methyl ester carboxylesterase